MLKVCDSNYCPNIAGAKAPTAPVLNTALHLHSNQILTNDFVEFRGQETFSLIDLDYCPKALIYLLEWIG